MWEGVCQDTHRLVHTHAHTRTGTWRVWRWRHGYAIQPAKPQMRKGRLLRRGSQRSVTFLSLVNSATCISLMKYKHSQPRKLTIHVLYRYTGCVYTLSLFLSWFSLCIGTKTAFFSMWSGSRYVSDLEFDVHTSLGMLVCNVLYVRFTSVA